MAEALGANVRIQRDDEGHHSSLMPRSWRRRHEQLAINQLVAWRSQWVLGDELAHLARGATAFSGWHGHNLLGARRFTQLGIRPH